MQRLFLCRAYSNGWLLSMDIPIYQNISNYTNILQIPQTLLNILRYSTYRAKKYVFILHTHLFFVHDQHK